MSLKEDALKIGGAFLAGGIASYLVFKIVVPKVTHYDGSDCINKCVEKDKAKCVNVFDMEDLPNEVAFCRCWRSSKFPYCDGTHNGHNKLTGDNVGPVCISRKS
ncbi:CDGSH iron-sulfur domain-containing protein 2 homolog [Hydractinia symbiolongicarpus]|uniref:CDGSH iron-sulfur domain-containing protein 2 homolog n=1 Tax=Hydractinia symbiolongicarpus TaxID=13093 RepID=UPI00254DE82B|nr:CDGSH iron-sulfur domain-containing protein 2 homolog [Hydractinia symbiolongicarpus]